MLKRFLAYLIAIPVAIALIVFAVANRNPITISFDPTAAETPLATIDLPLYLALFAALILGVVIGGAATWFGQGKWRRRARERHYEAAKWRFEADRNKERAENLAAQPALPAPTGHRDAA
ncbi:MAG: DUF1049 domain-containing protein [Hyphomicrobiales bacterium]|nr:DUF1049 domain-containing protein [Hyphomicrobiales bacterium]